MWKNWVLKIPKMVRKFLRDIFSTMYDDFDFKYMSAPRVWGWIACCCIVTALIAELRFEIKFSGWTQLVSWATACLGAYAAKKYSERGKPDIRQPTQKSVEEMKNAYQGTKK